MDAPAGRRILIIRLSAIGDIIMASGLIPALRSLWPEAHLAWLAEDLNAELLLDNPRLNKVHVLPRRRWRELRRAGQFLTLATELGAFARQLRAEHYDLVLDLQGLLKSGIWAYASGSARRIGLGSREGSQWLMTEVMAREMNDPRIGKEYRALAVQLGAAPESFVMDISFSSNTEAEARARLTAAGINGPYAVLAPFTTRPQKHWLDERWAELADRLGQHCTVVMLGGPSDRARAEGIAARCHTPPVNLTGLTRLPECAAIIAGANQLIGVDTGLTHLGSAMGVPTTALFGSTMPYLDTTRANGVVLYQPRDCSPCHRRPSCGGRFDCMRVHTVDAVLSAADSVFGRDP
jgi:heptosyltransferase-1